MSRKNSIKKGKTSKKDRNEKSDKSSFFKNVDILIPIIAVLSFINSIRAAFSQYYILEYDDDILGVSWISQQISHPWTLLLKAPWEGYRPALNIVSAIGYSIWGANEFFYYLYDGIFFVGAMVFLYLLIKNLSDKTSGLIAVLLYLFLDASFILVWKFNYIIATSELFLIVSSLYYSIKFFKTADRKNLLYAIPLAVFGFFTRELSIVIIPAVNIYYLLHNWNTLPFEKNVKKYIIFFTTLPLLTILPAILFFETGVGPSKTKPIIELMKSNLIFYIQQELSWQLKNPYLLILACTGTFYFYHFKHETYFKIPIETIKNTVAIVLIIAFIIISKLWDIYSLSGVLLIIMLCVISFIFADMNQRLGLVWFGVGLGPLLLSGLLVQPTYLAEANLGMSLFIGVTISKYLKYFLVGNPVQSKKIAPKIMKDELPQILKLITASLVIIIILFQLSVVPTQINNTNYYQKRVSDSQTSFKESIEYLKSSAAVNGVVYYIPTEQRAEIGGGQITAPMLQNLLCLKGRCDIEVKSLMLLDINTTRKPNHEFVALLSKLDIYIFNNKYQYLIKEGGFTSQKLIEHGDHAAVILGI